MSVREKIQAALDEAQKRAQVRLLSVEDVTTALAQRRKLARALGVKSSEILVIVSGSSERFPSSYNGTPMATYCRIYGTSVTAKRDRAGRATQFILPAAEGKSPAVTGFRKWGWTYYPTAA